MGRPRKGGRHGGEEDALLHGETLLVVSAGDAEDVALPLVAEGVSRDLLGDALVVEDAAEHKRNLRSGKELSDKTNALFLLVIEVDGLLFPGRGVCPGHPSQNTSCTSLVCVQTHWRC